MDKFYHIKLYLNNVFFKKKPTYLEIDRLSITYSKVINYKGLKFGLRVIHSEKSER